MSTAQLSRLLPLPDEDLKQVLDYASTLSKLEAVEHFRNLLGDSPEAVDFISSFNSRRQDPKSSTPASSNPASDTDGVPRGPKRTGKKKKAPLHTPAPRQVTDLGPAPGTVYNKKDLQDDYITRRPSPGLPAAASTSRPPQQPQKSATPPPSKALRSAAGHLISEMPKPKPKSTPVSRSSTPGPKTKITIAGGTAMHGASTALSDLDSAIRKLEMTTNPTQGSDDATRRCNCVAARHPLLAAAPNCLSCGKVVCVKEGLGPCTFCGTPILSSSEVQLMIRELKAERGREKMAADRDAHRRPEVSKAPAPFSRPREGPPSSSATKSEAEARALENRDRLLTFQAQNAQRTTVRDEAADFDVSGVLAGNGGNIWASPEDRARELKRQQKIMREMEWNARPDYEKRQQVLSIDLVGGKVVRKMAAVERPQTPEDEDDEPTVLTDTTGNRGGGAGTFSRNPLLGNLIKPMIKPILDTKGKGPELEGRKDRARTKWRRVQDDLDNNEGVILDGGAYGCRGAENQTATAAAGGGDLDDEPGCG
ncbi:putative zinc finger motif, C2HC5-type-domain-containing protein [Microdochium bolleyi]|uniref:Putative zinc finger motif, C2HC5-type-domain-containing protein n=1 Tax=Microdochium bolleyi TaxID=196109 RepID=A0A136IVV6_9PEZI|nr:putative zinc finger motif, C2HC5-type-domain-containing protein [Microdochium bolleyi]